MLNISVQNNDQRTALGFKHVSGILFSGLPRVSWLLDLKFTCKSAKSAVLSKWIKKNLELVI
jgi:hypothetical protein